MQETLVSIITPTYNSSRFIAQTIASIRAQTYLNWELLITDDASTDDTVKIVQYLARQDCRIKLFQLAQNCGAGAARNNSIERAKGRFIAFCDSDDCWKPDKLEKQIKYMTENGYSFSFSAYYEYDEQNKIHAIVKFPAKITKAYLLRNCIGCLTVIYDVRRVGKMYMPLMRKRQDWALWLQIIQKSHTAHGITEPLAYYRIRKNSVSASKLSLIRWNLLVYKQILGYGWIKRTAIFFFLFMPTYISKYLQKVTYQSYFGQKSDLKT